MTQAAKNPVGRRTAESKRHLKHVVQASTATAVLAVPGVSATKPTGNVIDLNDHPSVNIFFGGSDADGEAFTEYHVILWYIMDDGNGKQDWVPRLAAEGVVTLSSYAAPTNYIAADGFMADTITDTVSEDGTVVESPADNSPAMLHLDCHGAVLMEIDTDRGTAATADAWVQLGE